MFRYVAFVGEESDGEVAALVERIRESSNDWRTVYREGGVHVLCRGLRARSSEVYTLHGGRGIILGKLFETADAEESHHHAPLAFDVSESREILESEGRRLITSYWGRYVAILRASSGGATWIVRSPGGGLPCLRFTIGRTYIYLSSMEDGARLLAEPSINWDYVTAWLAARVHGRETGLQQVSRILGGECEVVRSGQVSRELYWRPLDIVKSGPIRSMPIAIDTLRQAVRGVVHAWSSCYERILVALSGGLDSSILAACLQDAPTRPAVTCMTHYVPGPASDERVFARAAANAAGLPLLELPRNPNTDLRGMSNACKSATLWNLIHAAELGRGEADLAARLQADAVFTGEGGDQLFFQARGALAVEDYIRDRGLRPGLFTVAFDAARMDRERVWEVLGQAIRARALGRPWSARSEVGRTRTLLTSQAMGAVRGSEFAEHPWLTEGNRVPSGTRWHIGMLATERPYYDPLLPDDNLPDSVTPLLMQPAMEAALRIRAYLHIHSGWDRAVARLAFKGEVPDMILDRRAKGDFEPHARQVLMHNLDFFRELLGDGILVRKRLVDGVALQRALSCGPSTIASENLELYDYLSAEIWLRSWGIHPG